MSSFKLGDKYIKQAIQHLQSFGDTDIFPHCHELEFFQDKQDEVVSAINSMDLIGDYKPLSAIECIAPKSNKSFRICHLLAPKDTLIVTSATLAIAENIEKKRLDADDKIAFAYRYEKDNISLFSDSCKYKEWLLHQKDLISNNTLITHVIKTDISDFYQRIYQHRLENELDSVVTSSQKNIKKLIINFISEIRSKQSFGIPVGTNSMRLLAELLLNATDECLLYEGYQFTRYVDDFRIFIDDSQDAYTCLAFLSEHLLISEGLSLGEHKTHIVTKEDYLEELNGLLGMEQDSEEGIEEVEILFHNLYDDDQSLDEANYIKLSSLNLVLLLEEELGKDKWDTGKIRILLRSMRITKDETSINYIYNNLENLLPFAKEVVLLIDELSTENSEEVGHFTEKVIKIILSPPVSENLPLIRAWFLELFVRGSIPITKTQLRRFKYLSHTLDKRQLILIHSRLEDQNYFRTRKTKFDEFTEFEKTSFVYGAKCLPMDELDKWLATIKRKPKSFFMVKEYCNWVMEVKNKEILASTPSI